MGRRELGKERTTHLKLKKQTETLLSTGKSKREIGTLNQKTQTKISKEIQEVVLKEALEVGMLEKCQLEGT
ncbi:unnamed protein product [Lathyrus oleraceus]